MKRITSLLVIAAALLAPLSRSEGQAGPTSATTLRPGQTVRVRMADGRRFQGRIADVDWTLLNLRILPLQETIPVTGIDSLWVRGNAAGRGALVGGLVVGGASLGFWALVCIAVSEGDCREWGTIALLTVGGGGAGALLGAGIGSLIPTWRRIDPKRVTVSLGAGPRGPTAVVRVRF